MVVAAERGHARVAIACLMLALASKQHILLLLPLTAMWPRFGLRRTVYAAGGALLLISPWIIAGPHDFWHDAVDANTGLGYRSDALCIATWAHKEFGHDPGFALTGLGLLIAYAIAWRARGDAFGFCAGAGLLVLALDITNTQSFFNHYTLGMALVVLAVCVRAGGSGKTLALGGETGELARLEQPAPAYLDNGVTPER
jgi:peptidoglycan/LPS O-acetylase OafA/YrhL